MAAQRPMRIVCAREIQKTLAESVKELVENKIKAAGLEAISEATINETRLGESKFLYMGMWRNPDAVKSLEGADIFWGEEASAFSKRSLDMIRPTMRKPGSELWFSWNPEFDTDPVDKLFRGEAGPPPNSIVREVTWRDNKWFDQSPLKAEMEFDYKTDPQTAEHVWGGGYVTAIDGAYYAEQLLKARSEGRIGTVARDPILRLRTFWDLGRRDATAIWVAQFVGREIRVIDYIEGRGQQLGYYVNELRSRGYQSALCVLPHDGVNVTLTATGSAQEQLEAADFEVEIIKNQGKSAAMLRVEASRRLFPQIWFNEEPCRPGLKALAAYHERRDEQRQVGLGPEHDWASDPADAFGLMCVAYEAPVEQQRARSANRYRGEGAWMS